MQKEATARIKINKLLEAAGWRFFADGKSPANIQLEPSITIKQSDLTALGEDFEKTSKGFIDFLLLNEKGFPFIVLEAKAEDKNPLVGKEQARKYARSQNCRFVILSNGNLHYFWDLERGNPYVITSFTIVRGSSPRPQGDPSFFGGSVPRLMVADITRDGMFVTPQIDSLTELGATKSRPMKRGDVIITVSGNPGLPTILAIDACIHDGSLGSVN